MKWYQRGRTGRNRFLVFLIPKPAKWTTPTKTAKRTPSFVHTLDSLLQTSPLFGHHHGKGLPAHNFLIFLVINIRSQPIAVLWSPLMWKKQNKRMQAHMQQNQVNLPARQSTLGIARHPYRCSDPLCPDSAYCSAISFCFCWTIRIMELGGICSYPMYRNK